MSHDSTLFGRASKALTRAKRKHQDALKKFTEKFIQEIEVEVLRAADQGRWCWSLVLSESSAYQKMAENDKYFPGLADSMLLSVTGGLIFFFSSFPSFFFLLIFFLTTDRSQVTLDVNAWLATQGPLKFEWTAKSAGEPHEVLTINWDGGA